MSIQKNYDDFNAVFAVVFMILLVAGALALITGHKPIPKPPEKPIEQVRQERNESFNAGGKAVNSFLKGILGKDVQKKEEVLTDGKKAE